MEKKFPYRFTLKFDPSIAAQKNAADLLNNRSDKASYLAAAILHYEQSAKTDFTDVSPTLADIYAMLQAISQQLNMHTISTNVSKPTAEIVMETNTLAIKPAEKELLRGMFAAFQK